MENCNRSEPEYLSDSPRVSFSVDFVDANYDHGSINSLCNSTNYYYNPDFEFDSAANKNNNISSCSRTKTNDQSSVNCNSEQQQQLNTIRSADELFYEGKLLPLSNVAAADPEASTAVKQTKYDRLLEPSTAANGAPSVDQKKILITSENIVNPPNDQSAAPSNHNNNNNNINPEISAETASCFNSKGSSKSIKQMFKFRRLSLDDILPLLSGISHINNNVNNRTAGCTHNSTNVIKPSSNSSSFWPFHRSHSVGAELLPPSSSNNNLHNLRHYRSKSTGDYTSCSSSQRGRTNVSCTSILETPSKLLQDNHHRLISGNSISRSDHLGRNTNYGAPVNNSGNAAKDAEYNCRGCRNAVPRQESISSSSAKRGKHNYNMVQEAIHIRPGSSSTEGTEACNSNVTDTGGLKCAGRCASSRGNNGGSKNRVLSSNSAKLNYNKSAMMSYSASARAGISVSPVLNVPVYRPAGWRTTNSTPKSCKIRQ